jgi:hypothetical protein
MIYELKDWLKSINFSKNNLLEENPDSIKEYPPFIINRILSGEIDCIMYANEMNISHYLDKDMQYSFYLNSLRKKRRYSPLVRKDNIKDLECVKTYYGYSNEKAKQSLRILNKEQIDFIKQRLETGGTK